MPRQPIERRPRREEVRVVAAATEPCWAETCSVADRDEVAATVQAAVVRRSPRGQPLDHLASYVGVVLVIVQLVAALWIVIAIADPLLMVLAARTGRGGDRERAERLRRQTLLVSAAIFFGSVVVMWPIFLVWASPA